MKKFLLLSICLTAFTGFSQTFWTAKATGFSEVSRGLDHISIVDANVVWAKAYDGVTPTAAVRQFTRSIDGGNTWTSGPINLGTNQNFLSVSSICGISATTAWVTAYSNNPNTVLGGIWKTTDSGATWTKQSTALFNNVADSFTNIVYFWDANNGFAQGDPIDGYFELYTTSNGGTTWTRVPSANIPAPLNAEYGYVHNYDVVGDIIWFGTNKGRMYKSIDKGLNWTVSQTPISDFGGATTSGSYSFKDANNGLLVKKATSPLLYKTVNGGTSWTQVTYSGLAGGNGIAYIPGTDNVVSIGTSGADNYTSYSINNGMNWTQVMPGTQVTTLKFYNGNVGYGGGFSTSAFVGGVFKYTGTVLANDKFTSNTKLAAWPNPTQNTIQFSGADVASINVIDLLGKVVLSQNLASGTSSVDVSNLPNGMYLVQASDANGSVSTVKFIKN